MNSLSARDRQVIWHPYTQMKTAATPLSIVKGEGSYLFDEKGRNFIDAISSWWVNLHGHAHPYLAEKLYEQAGILEHVIFAGFTHEPAVRLAERLLAVLPSNQKRIFYSDNGSTAVEVALKMAIQSRRNAGEQETKLKKGRSTILALRNSYHGDTFGAMSVSERGLFTLPFHDYLFDVIFLDAPTSENISSLRSTIAQLKDSICCFIYEPLVQGAGGMKMYAASALNELLKACREHKILCIADEVMTGFYRTGKCFASEYVQEQPDIICMSKGITGGMLPLGATSCTSQIFDAFLSEDRTKTFFHGHSYTANPLSCAVANASLDLLQKEECISRIQRIVQLNEAFLLRIQHPSDRNKKYQPRNFRQTGTIIAYELETGSKDEYLNTIGTALSKKAMEYGVLIRPLGNTLYIMPPYCITDSQLEKVYDCLVELMN